MGLFKRKDKATSKIQESDTEVIKHDFTQRAPFATYIPIDYRILGKFMMYGISLNIYLDELCKGDLDHGNANVLDELIEDIAMQAQTDLEHQKAEHINIINNFGIRREADREWFQLHRIQLQEVCDELRIELDQAKTHYKEYQNLKMEGNSNEKK